jgi:hypothetical protein
MCELHAAPTGERKGDGMIPVDPKCVELARYFMEDEDDVTEQKVMDLAAAIQQAVEDHLQWPTKT